MHSMSAIIPKMLPTNSSVSLLRIVPLPRPCVYLSLVGQKHISRALSREGLVERAGKLFIWAAMAVRFVGDCQGRGPISRLKTLLSGPIGLNSGSSNPYMHLDSLYSDILSQTMESVSIEDINVVVGTVIQLHSEMSLDAIVRFLGDDENKVEMALNRIQSIIPIPTDRS